ncbi:FxsA family membrane protein [Streptomyces cyaneofuscatus]|uniref:FxsA family membrane protein n=1 Tax=Streptomyces cyaneofuscatus TaxID=66883 RepID=UPI002954BF51|nr:FxsA family membrane protein [Streptomyces cyaneofuscatus]WOP12813.1 FxsA family membrane protein [Streptomyces cyaneofuscatus]WRO08925.1 FxsA family membrane protein [Streptomyces cyaneofuscatus]
MTTGTPPPTRPRRSRARRFLPLALAAWLVLEIWLLTVVASAAGGLTVLLLLVAGAVLGTVVIKRAGRRAFKNLTETLQQMPGQPGATEAPQVTGGKASQGNGLLMLGGLLLLIPGLISDAAGLLLLIPPVRTAISRRAERSLERRMRAASPGSLSDAFQQARMHRPDGKVVQGEVIREDGTQPPSRPSGPDDDPRGPRPPLTP